MGVSDPRNARRELSRRFVTSPRSKWARRTSVLTPASINIFGPRVSKAFRSGSASGSSHDQRRFGMNKNGLLQCQLISVLSLYFENGTFYAPLERLAFWHQHL